MIDCILCVDIGTSSLKAALLSDNLKSEDIFVSRKSFPDSAFCEDNSGTFYLQALKDALSEIRKKNPDHAIEAVCVSGNGPTVIGEDGVTLLHNKLYVNGSRGRAGNLSQNKKIALKNTKSLFIPKLWGFKHNFTFSWNDSKYIFGAPEFLLYKLTDCPVSILSEERFLDFYWTNDELLACGFTASDIEKLPPFVNAGSLVGKITEKAAAETGLLEGTLVFAGAPDFVTALIGTGTVMASRLCDRAGSSEGLNLCTKKPIFAEGLRTMPSVIPGLWNLSYLLTPQIRADSHRLQNENSHSSALSASYFEELSHGIALLREAASANGEAFPETMAITGGQALDSDLISKKEEAAGIKIKKMPCADAELIGDLILARVALGDYDDITEAVFAILGAYV